MKLQSYYWTRLVGAAALCSLLILFGTPPSRAALMFVVLVGLIVWAPHSGRYLVRPDAGALALQRDERTKAISQQAARNGFVAVMLLLGAIGVVYGAVLRTDVPVDFVSLVLAIGAVTYFGSDAYLRRGN
jgi:TRAP-type uncharacterized transport system fused permease subunit